MDTEFKYASTVRKQFTIHNMTLQEKINANLKSAMLSKNEFEKSILRVLIGEFNRIDKTVSDEKAMSIIKKMIENAKIVGNTFEVTYLEKYLPQQLSVDDLNKLVSQLIEDKKYSSLKDMGKVMNDLKAEYAGQYDGKLASEIIKSKLTQIPV